jgi:hypothetical protein
VLPIDPSALSQKYVIIVQQILAKMIKQNDPHHHFDPAADAAGLLRRVGFITLSVALPLAAMVSRRASVLLAPIGVALLIAASIVEEPGYFQKRLRRVFSSIGGMVLILLTGWICLAAAWSPFPEIAMEKAINTVFAVLIGVLGVGALPARTRASNLNLVAIGIVAAAIFATLLSIPYSGSIRQGAISDTNASLGRGFIVLSILVWPAVAWLLSRGRPIGAVVLALLTTLVAVMRLRYGGTGALLIGGIVFAAMAYKPAPISRLISWAGAGLLIVAPLAAVITPFLIKNTGSVSQINGCILWTEVIFNSPVKLLTGHGLGTVLQGKFTGILPLAAPSGLLFETWYELGAVGAFSASFLFFNAVRSASGMPGPLAAGGVAAYSTAFAFAIIDQAVMQGWWLFTLATAAILFTAIVQGQFQTERPKAKFRFR